MQKALPKDHKMSCGSNRDGWNDALLEPEKGYVMSRSMFANSISERTAQLFAEAVCRHSAHVSKSVLAE